jgi:hypothetical protein
MALLALLAGVMVLMIARAGDAWCSAAIRWHEPHPQSNYRIPYRPCEANGWGNEWEIAGIP